MKFVSQNFIIVFDKIALNKDSCAILYQQNDPLIERRLNGFLK